MSLLMTLTSCQLGRQRDSFSVKRSFRSKLKSGRDSYSASPSGRRKFNPGRDSYTAKSKRNSVSEGRDSYSTNAKRKFTWKFWKYWKKPKAPRDSYSEDRRRKVIRKRKPPQGIRNN